MTEPMASHDVVAFSLLAEAVSADVKVVQCGQGADEVFAGYAYHAPFGLAGARATGDALSNVFADRPERALRRLVRSGAVADHDVSGELLAAHLSRPACDSGLDAVLRADTHLLMSEDPVKRVDCMTMAWGVEARVPFLDQDLVALVAACPPELKACDDGKGVLKRIGRRLLPPHVVDRPKGSFPVPALTHLDGDVLALARDALSPAHSRVRQVIRDAELDRMLAAPNAAHTRVGGNALWPLVVLELWLQEHVPARG
ncbi:asparagine synthase-related protein [Microbacterium sp. 10M-3C3]|jgi:asparagine synthase (glutamine-hydrolysing)|uniref:asparagine synthase-related protein n=1 Tax=Microbacterium sp. 10M-3C3 TaxID=2483401 RepID=UPI0023E8246B|nr:asparagine synthase-related protein [Microbacterium sp. 10M-3C3]